MSHELVLYKYDSCPFCYRVQSWLDGRDVPIKYRDTRMDPDARQELVDLTGRSQVPCLVIDGEPMLESGDILAWLQANYGDEDQPAGKTPAPAKAAAAPERPGRRATLLSKLRRR